MKRLTVLPLLAVSLFFSGSALAQPAGAAEPEAPAAPAEAPPPLPQSRAHETPAQPLPYTEADEPMASPPEEAPPIERFRFQGGLKVGYVATRGFDAFAESNTLPQFSIDGTYAFWNHGRVALAAGLGWDVGGRGDPLRGIETALTTHRFFVPIEARVRVASWLWGFGRVAPGAALLVADVEDPSSPRSLGGSGWAFAADLSAGATFEIGKRKPGKRAVRFLLTPEIGYAVTTAAPIHLNPGRDEEDLLGADADASLRSVALSGLFWRATAGVAF